MVAITVVSIIVGLLLIDLFVQFAEGWYANTVGSGGALALAGGGSVPLEGALQFPEGLFLDRTHAWARLDPGGGWRIGVDGGLVRLLGVVDQVVVVSAGQTVREGDPLATVRQGLHLLTIRSPVGGKVIESNADISGARLAESPYDAGWLCVVRSTALAADTKRMLVGEDAERWHRAEVARIEEFLAGAAPDGRIGSLSEADRSRFQRTFLDAAR